MKKILMFTSDKLFCGRQTGGLKRFIELYRHLSQKYDVTICSRDCESVFIDKNIKGVTMPKSAFEPRILPEGAKIFLNNFAFLRKLKKGNFDTVIAFDIPSTIILNILFYKNVFLFVRQDFIKKRKLELEVSNKNFLYKFFYINTMLTCEGFSLRCSKKVITQCNFDLMELIARHKAYGKKLLRKSNIQINNINPSWVVENSTKKINRCENETFRLCYIGDFSSEVKGYSIFLQAVKNIIEQGKIIEVFLAGDGKFLNGARKQYSVYKNIYFVGRIRNPIPLMKQCDVLVVPSLSDSCPNVILEALYNNIPVIGAESGGIPELLKYNQALFIPNVNYLTEKLEGLIKDPSILYKILEKQELRKQELTFNWGETIENILII